jgi:uncharacterized protein
LQKKGHEHEGRFLEHLRQKSLRVEVIDVKAPSSKRIRQTRKALQSGADVIYQAAFEHAPFMGLSDFLFRVDKPSDLGDFSYEVADTKLARSAKARHLVQLCLYSELLANEQGVMPEHVHLILGNGKQESFAVAEYIHYVRHVRDRFIQFVTGQQQTYPDKCRHCDSCEFTTLCKERWVADDHLNRVANIRATDIKKLRQAGIHTMRDLVERGDPTVNPIPKIAAQEQLWHQATLQFRQPETGDTVELKPLQADKLLGFHRLPKPDDGDLYFDMEGDPMEDGGLEYLFGVGYVENGEFGFQPFWGHDRAGEKKAFEDFIDFVMDRIRQHPNLHIYHYADYENRALKKLMSNHGTREAEVDALLRDQRLVDLYAVVRHAIYTSEPRYSIKNLETFYMKGKRQADVKNAGASIIYYERWKETRDPKLLDEICDYNKDDCLSTWLLHEWLLKLRPENLPWYEKALEVTKEEKPERTQQKLETQARRQKFGQALLANLPEDMTSWSDDHHLQQLLYYLLDFYWRESKPSFWRMFDRQSKTVVELLDDLDCLAGLTLVSDNPEQDGRSFLVTYRCPEQESKVSVGDACQDTETLQGVGVLHAFDVDTGCLQLRVGPTVMKRWGDTPPSLLSISSAPSVNNKPLQAALERFVASHCDGDGKYAAIEEFLRRKLPRLSDRSPGAPIVSDPAHPLESAIVAISALDRSYLFIQGPPGTGKTYTGAHIILALLQWGKRIGVCANSHKAIINLLAAVEKEALKTGYWFLGAKKSGGDDTRFDGRLIKDIGGDEIFDEQYRLVGGTAWVFANEKADQKFDYLFVDEAGQVSLANLIAMSTAARNLVLLGDQMQLGQPIQGSHPGESGLSALQYLLGDQATILADRGIFLSTSWRMHLDICDFISKLVYERRLVAHPDNAQQSLLLQCADIEQNENNGNPAEVPNLKPSGIQFIPIDHDGCSQSSEEEAQLVQTLINYLLMQRYRDRYGNEHPIEPENILVVAPYNAQVKLLRSLLAPSIRVGTVDKFQGMEAEVVLISMTTSSEEYLPRQMEFLYDKHRLNVAISRAKTLALLIASPRLREIKCNTVNQTALVNTLCAISRTKL